MSSDVVEGGVDFLEGLFLEFIGIKLHSVPLFRLGDGECNKCPCVI